VRPLVADRQLERIGLPLVQRRRRLHVEVPVEENGRLAVAAAARRDLTEGQLLVAERRQVARAARAADELTDPFAGDLDVVAVRGIRAHARNAQELRQLVDPGGVHGRGAYRGRSCGSGGSCACGSSSWSMLLRPPSTIARAPTSTRIPVPSKTHFGQ